MRSGVDRDDLILSEINRTLTLEEYEELKFKISECYDAIESMEEDIKLLEEQIKINNSYLLETRSYSVEEINLMVDKSRELVSDSSLLLGGREFKKINRSSFENLDSYQSLVVSTEDLKSKLELIRQNLLKLYERVSVYIKKMYTKALAYFENNVERARVLKKRFSSLKINSSSVTIDEKSSIDFSKISGYFGFFLHVYNRPTSKDLSNWIVYFNKITENYVSDFEKLTFEDIKNGKLEPTEFYKKVSTLLRDVHVGSLFEDDEKGYDAFITSGRNITFIGDKGSRETVDFPEIPEDRYRGLKLNLLVNSIVIEDGILNNIISISIRLKKNVNVIFKKMDKVKADIDKYFKSSNKGSSDDEKIENIKEWREYFKILSNKGFLLISQQKSFIDSGFQFLRVVYKISTAGDKKIENKDVEEASKHAKKQKGNFIDTEV